MALSKDKALNAARDILMSQRVDEAARLDRIHLAMQPTKGPGEFIPTVSIPADAPARMQELARKSDTNYLPLLVKTFRQIMKGDGYYSVSDEGARDPWFWWQVNRMDSRQTGLVDGALTYGVSYASAIPGVWGRGNAGPAISCYSPREMTALYQDPASDEWPMLALGRDADIVSLLDETTIYRFGVESSVTSGSIPLTLGAGNLTYIDQSDHDLGVVPVVRYRDRNLLAGEESLGIVEPLLVANERITETTFQAMVIQYTQAFMQRYVIGWVPKTEQAELKAGAARIWYIDEDPADVNIGQLDAGKVDLSLRESAQRDFASLGQIPAQVLGIDGISNISDATLAGLEAAKNREGGEIMTSLGESHEQLLRLCAYIDGNDSAADDYSSEFRWREHEARSFAQTVDGLVKLVGGQPLVAPEVAVEELPGMTPQRIERNKAAMRRAAGSSMVDRLLGGSGGVAPASGSPAA